METLKEKNKLVWLEIGQNKKTVWLFNRSNMKTKACLWVKQMQKKNMQNKCVAKTE